MDFTGFKFNGYHSSSMNFVRTSDGSRYEENLIPAFQDKTLAVPGGDGTYFFDSFYTNRTFTIQIAFDSMTEANLRQFRKVFNTKAMGPLIFDETPYKAYVAKVQNPPQLKYICFDKDNRRVYKGEGTIQFVCYNPYARSVHKYLSEYTSEYNEYLLHMGITVGEYRPSTLDVPPLYIPGQSTVYSEEEWLAQWKDGSGMVTSSSSINNHLLGINGANIKVYNPGNVETDFLAFYSFGEILNSPLRIQLKKDGNILGELNFRAISQISTHDQYICINSRTNLVEGYSAIDTNSNDHFGARTGTLYNSYISSGNFFKIPVSDSTSDIYTFHSESNGTDVSCGELYYNYLYY